MITTQKPPDFNHRFEVVSCFIERDDGSILLLLRLPEKSEGGKWGMPAGKVETHEALELAIRREAWEETGICLEDPLLFCTYYIRYPDYDYVYHVFHCSVPSDTAVKISRSEHLEYRWSKPLEALSLELVRHQDDCIRFFYARGSVENKH